MAVVTGTPSADFLDGTSAPDELSGLAGDDVLYGYGGADSLNGGTGNDWLDGGAGIDTLVGGVGDDVYIVSRLEDVVVEAAGAGTDRVETQVTLTLPSAIEDGYFIGAGEGGITGNARDNFIYGNEFDNTLVGGAGTDSLYGRGGDDALNGGTGNDWLDGGAGIDTLVGGVGDDVYIVSRLDDVVVEAADAGTDRVETRVTLTLPSAIEDGYFIGAGAGGITGNGRDNFIYGNEFDNTLMGGAGSDFLYALGGGDSLEGGAGDDLLDGGAGVDTMVGGTGDEVYIVTHLADVVVELAGEGSSDRIETKVSLTLPDNIEDGNFIGAGDGSIIGNDRDNYIYGNGAENTLVGGAGADFLYGYGGNDSLVGGTGNDWLDGGAGIDTMVGGTGDEVYIVTHLADVVVERADGGFDRIETKVSLTLPGPIEQGNFIGAGDGSVVGNALDNFIYGNDSDNTLVGGAGVDFLYGYRGNDSLVGGAGDDRLDGGAGVDTMVGGGGDDIYVVNTVSDLVVEAPGKGTDWVETSVSLTLPDNIEGGYYTGPAGGSIVGNSFDNFITGNAFDNTLGGAGGIDTVSYAYEDSAVTVDLAGGNASGSGSDVLTDFENAEGGEDGDTLIGSFFDNVLDGRGGADSMEGGNGNDTYLVDDVGDVVVETGNGAGALAEDGSAAALDDFTDTVVAAVSYSLADVQFVENLTLEAGATAGTGNVLPNKLTGNGLHNTLNGLGGNDTLDGGNGRDTMTGGAGNDVYYVSVTGDVVTEGNPGGIDEIRTAVTLVTLAANVENLLLTGNAGISAAGNGLANTITGNSAGNTLSGGGQADTLIGGGGGDVLRGNAGNDTLTGNAGRDRFEFSAALDASANVDRITDFSPLSDTMWLEDAVFTVLTAGVALAGAAFYGNAGATAAHDSNDRIIYNTTSGRVYYDADGNAASHSSIHFATLAGTPAITAADFFIT